MAGVLSRPDAEVLARIGRCLASPARLQLLSLLLEFGPTCQRNLIDGLAKHGTTIGPPAVSHHLTALRLAGLVERERHGAAITFRLSTRGLHVMAAVGSWGAEPWSR